MHIPSVTSDLNIMIGAINAFPSIQIVTFILVYVVLDPMTSKYPLPKTLNDDLSVVLRD
jgi:hypothetical protein